MDSFSIWVILCFLHILHTGQSGLLMVELRAEEDFARLPYRSECATGNPQANRHRIHPQMLSATGGADSIPALMQLSPAQVKNVEEEEARAAVRRPLLIAGQCCTSLSYTSTSRNKSAQQCHCSPCPQECQEMCVSKTEQLRLTINKRNSFLPTKLNPLITACKAPQGFWSTHFGLSLDSRPRRTLLFCHVGLFVIS